MTVERGARRRWQAAARSRSPRSTPAPTSSRSARWASATPPRPRCWCTAWRRRRSTTASAPGPARTTRAWRASAPPSHAPPRAATRPRRSMCSREFGGLEIAMMAGAVLGRGFAAPAGPGRRLHRQRGRAGRRSGCVRRRATTASSRIARPRRATTSLLAALGAQPLLDLGLRLGEGTGALLAVPLVRAAARLLTDVADLSDVLAGNI